MILFDIQIIPWNEKVESKMCVSKKSTWFLSRQDDMVLIQNHSTPKFADKSLYIFWHSDYATNVQCVRKEKR